MTEEAAERLARLEDALATGLTLEQFAADEGIKPESLQRWLYRIGRHDLAPNLHRERRTRNCPDCGKSIEPRSERCDPCYRVHVQLTRRRCRECGAITSGLKTGLCRPCWDASIAKPPRLCVDCQGPVQGHTALRCRDCEIARRARVKDELAQEEIRRWLQEGLA